MSLIADILDRLSGVAVVREKLTETSQRVNELAALLLDHEKRLVRLETRLEPGDRPPPLPKRSSRGRKSGETGGS